MRTFLRDGKHDGFYLLGAGLTHKPRLCAGRMVIGDSGELHSLEPATFTFVINAAHSVLFLDPRDTLGLGKIVTATEAYSHPLLPSVHLIINLALKHEKIIAEYLNP